MITNEQKLFYILAEPRLGVWAQSRWDDTWQEYIEWCTETAELNNETLEETMEWLLFLDWLEEYEEDQAYCWEMAREMK
jgi:hypothetical protein